MAERLSRTKPFDCEPISVATLVGFCSSATLSFHRLIDYFCGTLVGSCGWATLPFDRLSCYFLQQLLGRLDFVADPPYPLIVWAAISCHPFWIFAFQPHCPFTVWAAIFCNPDWILRLNHYTHWFFEPLSIATLIGFCGWTTIYTHWFFEPLSIATLISFCGWTTIPIVLLSLYLLTPLLKVWLSQTTLWPCEPLSFATLAGLCRWAMVPFHHLIIWTTIFCNSSGLCGWAKVQYPDRLPHYLWQPFLDLVATTLWPFAPLSFAPLFDLFGSCGWATLPFAHLSRYLLQPLLNFVAEPQYPQIIWATSVSFASVVGCDVWATPHFVENYVLPGLGRIRVPSLLANVYMCISYICTYSLYKNRLNFELFEPSPL